MKRALLFIGSIVLAMLLTACGDGDNSDTNDNTQDDTTTEEQQEEENEDQEDTTTAADHEYMKEQIDELDYVEFELEVKYEDDQEYEAEIEHKNNGKVKAKLEDDLSNVNLKGREAFDEIFPIIEKLTIDEQTSEEDVIKEVLEAFNLNDDYIKFELELTFKDNTKKEFKDKK